MAQVEYHELPLSAIIKNFTNTPATDLLVLWPHVGGRMVIPAESLGFLAGALGSSGELLAGSSATAGVTLTETSAAATLTAVQILEEETLPAEVIVTTDGGGASGPDTVVAAPAAGNHIVVKSARILGTNKIGATFTFNDTAGSVLTGDEIAKGRAAPILRSPVASATALTVTTAGGGAAVSYTVAVSYSVVTD